MKSKLIPLFTYISLTLASSTTFAGSGSFYFNQIGVVQDGAKIYGLIQLASNLSLVPQCASENSNQLSFLIEGDFGKLIYATALAAVTAQKQVWLTYSDTNCGLWGSRAISSRIDIKR